MTVSDLTTPAEGALSPTVPSSRRGLRHVLRHNVTLVVGSVLILGVLVIAIVVPLLDVGGATRIDSASSLQPPSAQHLLGADQLGRDLLTRVAQGYRISLAVSVGSVGLALLVGIPLGLVAAVGPSLLGGAIMRVMDVFMAFPALLLAIVVVALAGAGTGVLLLAIAIIYTPVITRVTRAAALETSRESFVDAARARGSSTPRLVFRHVTPNSLGPVVVQASILMAVSILLEAGLSFIGLGVQPPTPSLGLLLATGRDFMASSPWVVAVPGVAIVTIVLGFTLVGDGLQDWLDPRKRAMAR